MSLVYNLIFCKTNKVEFIHIYFSLILGIYLFHREGEGEQGEWQAERKREAEREG